MATRKKKDHLIRFRCECGKKLKAEPDIIGKKVQCTQCPRIHRVPPSDRLGPKKETSSKSTKSVGEPAPLAKNNSATAPETTASKEKLAPASAASTSPLWVPKDESQSSSRSEKPNLIIRDELAAKEPSLLPKSDDSDSRFKLDPKFDPEPTEKLPSLEDSFEFDLANLQLDTAKSPQPKQLPRQRFQRSPNKTAIFAGVAVVLSLVLLALVCRFAFGQSSFPTEFTQRPEVQNYVTKIKEFRKSQQTLKIVSAAYVKKKSPPPQEREQIETFNRSIEPLANEEEKLTEALKLFQASQIEQARSALINATQTLDQKIPELEAKAEDFASKLR